MAVIRAMRILMPKSGIVADQIVNTFYFTSGTGTADPAASVGTQIGAALDDFYNLAVGAGQAVRFYTNEGATNATTSVTYKMYNMDAAKPRAVWAAPVAQHLTPRITTAGLPSEVCACLSFRGSLVSGANAARRRGRVYIGPLNTAAQAQILSNGQMSVIAGLQNALVNGANRLRDDLAALAIGWGVYSPTTRGAGPALDGFVPIVHAWCDDAFDTQRRRGFKATQRVMMDVF